MKYNKLLDKDGHLIDKKEEMMHHLNLNKYRIDLSAIDNQVDFIKRYNELFPEYKSKVRIIVLEDSKTGNAVACGTLLYEEKTVYLP